MACRPSDSPASETVEQGANAPPSTEQSSGPPSLAPSAGASELRRTAPSANPKLTAGGVVATVNVRVSAVTLPTPSRPRTSQGYVPSASPLYERGLEQLWRASPVPTRRQLNSTSRASAENRMTGSRSVVRAAGISCIVTLVMFARALKLRGSDGSDLLPARSTALICSV